MPYDHDAYVRRRAAETPEQRQARRQYGREAAAALRRRRKDEGWHPSPEEAERRRKHQAAYEARARAKDPEAYAARQAANTARHRAKHPERAAAATKRYLAKPEGRAKFNAGRRAYREKNIVRVLVNEARGRAKRLGTEFTITAADVPPIGEACPIFGIPFQKRTPGNRTGYVPSLDRIDSRLGYVPGNVWIISDRANRVKNDGTAWEHEMIAKAMRERENNVR